MEHDVIHYTRKTDTCYEKVLSSRDYIEGTGLVKEVLSQDAGGPLRYIGVRTCERKKKQWKGVFCMKQGMSFKGSKMQFSGKIGRFYQHLLKYFRLKPI